MGRYEAELMLLELMLLGKDGTVLDESFVSDRAVGNVDSRAESKVEGDYGSVLGMEFGENGFEVGERFVDP